MSLSWGARFLMHTHICLSQVLETWDQSDPRWEHKMEITSPNYFCFTEIKLMLPSTKHKEFQHLVKFHWPKNYLCQPKHSFLFSFNVISVVLTKSSRVPEWDARECAGSWELNSAWHFTHLNYRLSLLQKIQDIYSMCPNVARKKNILLTQHNYGVWDWRNWTPRNVEQQLTGMELRANKFWLRKEEKGKTQDIT